MGCMASSTTSHGKKRARELVPENDGHSGDKHFNGVAKRLFLGGNSLWSGTVEKGLGRQKIREGNAGLGKCNKGKGKDGESDSNDAFEVLLEGIVYRNRFTRAMFDAVLKSLLEGEE